jgi:hypothetical protein
MKAIALSLTAFLLAFAAVRRAFPGGIMFYQGVMLSVLCGLACLIWARVAARQAVGVALKDGLLSFLLAYSFMFTIPTTVDRSYSVKLINALGATPQGMRREQIESLFAVDFVRGGAVARRIDEQTRSGIVEQGQDAVRLTPLGRVINRSFELACVVFTCHADPSPAPSPAPTQVQASR